MPENTQIDDSNSVVDECVKELTAMCKDLEISVFCSVN